MSFRKRRRALFPVLFILGFAAPVAGGSIAAEPLPGALLGAWADPPGSGRQLRFEPTRLLEANGGSLKIWGIEGYEGGKIKVRSGVVAWWQIALGDGGLSLERSGKAESYRKLDRIPDDLELRLAEMAKAHEIPAERLKAVQGELAQRRKKDQEVRMDSARASEMGGIDEENRRYLQVLVSEVGWIDVDRFGAGASASAFLVVQHSSDLSLMMAALPLIEKDARHYPDFAQPYTLLYDRLQIDLGEKQRYGTQLDRDAKGNPFVLPLEDPARVDQYLKELGLPPLSDYLATASKYLYGGKAIRIPMGDE